MDHGSISRKLSLAESATFLVDGESALIALATAATVAAAAALPRPGYYLLFHWVV